MRATSLLVFSSLGDRDVRAVCCVCGARTRRYALVRPYWGQLPCPQGHSHHPLELVALCENDFGGGDERGRDQGRGRKAQG